MQTFKDIWYAVIDNENTDRDGNGVPCAVHQFENEAREDAARMPQLKPTVERVRVTIDRIIK